MSYQSLEIKDLYIKSLEEQNDTLLVAIYHLLNTINGYHSVTVKELNDYSMIEEESLREKIKIILKTNKPLDLFNTLLENSPKEDAKKYLLNLNPLIFCIFYPLLAELFLLKFLIFPEVY